VQNQFSTFPSLNTEEDFHNTEGDGSFNPRVRRIESAVALATEELAVPSFWKIPHLKSEMWTTPF
jgi:hypothetical protein